MAYDFRIRRRCASPKTMMWSAHSRRIDPISRSAKPFCQGEAGAIGLSRMPMARSRRATTVAVDPIVVPDHVARSLVPGECLRYLTCYPFGGWMCRDVDPDKISAV